MYENSRTFVWPDSNDKLAIPAVRVEPSFCKPLDGISTWFTMISGICSLKVTRAEEKTVAGTDFRECDERDT